MAEFVLHLLGAPRLEHDGKNVHIQRRKTMALLAYLAVIKGPHRRDALAALLWPEQDTSRARAYLRRILSLVNHALGGAGILADREIAGLCPDLDLVLDVDAFRGRLAVCEAHHHHVGEACSDCVSTLDAAVELYGGDFMEGFSLNDSASFDEWQFYQTQALRDAVTGALARMVAWLSDQGERSYEQAIAYARRWLALDPLHEPAHRQLMALYAKAGQRSAALRQYRACVRLLADELGTEPREETTALYERIRSMSIASDGVLLGLQDGESDIPSFIEATVPVTGQAPVFVAREAELTRLDQFLERALSGRGQVVFVTGEAGQGKTALMQAFASSARARVPDLVVADGRCNAYTGVGDPYLPFREILALLTGDVQARYAAGTLTRAHALRLWHTLPLSTQALLSGGRDLIGTLVTAVPLMQRVSAYESIGTEERRELQGLVDASRAGAASPPQRDLFEQVTAVLRAIARDAPLLLIVDDLQWADLGSIGLLFHLGRRLSGSRILLLGAYRPEEMMVRRAGERHPLEAIVQELRRDGGDITVDLAQADGQRFVQALVDSEPHALSRDFCKTLYWRTEGHPLYAVELLRGMQERGDLRRDPEGRWMEADALNWELLPVRIEAVIAGRIGRLDYLSRQTLRIASVQGEVFTAEVVADVQAEGSRTTRGEVVSLLSGPLCRQHRLVRAEGVEQLGHRRLSVYRFQHILFQTYLYHDLDSAERASFHEQVGTAMERLYGDQTEEICLDLARHFEEAGSLEKAVTYLHRAGERALRLSANEGAVDHLTRALRLLERIPGKSKLARQELAVQLSLGAAFLASRGYGSSEVGNAYGRARALCEEAEETEETLRALWGLGIYYVMRAEIQVALGVASQMLSIADHLRDPAQDALAHYMMGWTLLQAGRYHDAHDHLQRVVDFYDPERHRSLVFAYGADLGVHSLAWTAWTLWAMGYPDQARARSEAALSLAQGLDHLLTKTFAESVAGFMFNAFCLDFQTADRHNKREIELAIEGRLPFYQAMGASHQGRLLTQQDQLERGRDLLRAGLDQQSAIGVEAYRPLYLTWLAEACAQAGQIDQGLATSAQALDLVTRTDEAFIATEAHRVRGELLLTVDVEAAQACFHRALEVSRRQGAKMWELRTTMSLARLWREQGHITQARGCLAQAFGWFTEGFETQDLQAARQLLTVLGG